jgi:hypothetical protein
MATVIFADGAVLSAATWRELEQALREDSWNNSPDKGSFREELAQRAWNWSESALHTEGSSRRLFAELEDAGMARVVDEEAGR